MNISACKARRVFGRKPASGPCLDILLPFLVLISLICILPSTCFAGSVNTQEESEKITRYAKDVRKPMPGGVYTEKEVAFGRNFLSDAAAKRGIEIIAPIVETDKYDDPKLQNYIDKCPNLDLNVTVSGGSYEAKFPEQWNQMSDEEKKQTGYVYVWTKGFRLYEIKMNKRIYYILRETAGYETFQHKDPRIMKKQIEEEKKNPAKPITRDATYRVLDLNTCQDYDGVYACGEWDYFHDKSKSCSNGVLKYRDKYYVYGMRNTPDDPTVPESITMWDMKIKEKGKKDSRYKYRFYLFNQLKKEGN